ALSLRPIAVVDVTIGLAALCVKSFGERCDAQQQMCPGSGGYARRFGPVMTMNMFKMNVVHAAGRLVLAPASPGSLIQSQVLAPTTSATPPLSIGYARPPASEAGRHLCFGPGVVGRLR